MSSQARKSHISGAKLMLLFLDLMGYLKCSALESLKNKRVAVKEKCLDLLLFARTWQGSPILLIDFLIFINHQFILVHLWLGMMLFLNGLQARYIFLNRCFHLDRVEMYIYRF